jgi:hypothetical protein
MNGIYKKPGRGTFFSPFNFSIENMERLLLINFEKDPDEQYVGFEPQVFDDDQTGRGIRVLAYRKDKKIDVYQRPGMYSVKSDFDVAGKGCENLVERPLENARFEMTSQGLKVAFSFEDIQGRSIDVLIAENSSQNPKTFSLLAPLGSSTENPPALPLFFLFDFGFVRRAGTTVRVKIEGREHRLDSLPLPLEGQPVFFTRYSLDPFLLSWNTGREGLLPVIEGAQAGKLETGPVKYFLVEKEGHLEIEQVRVTNSKHTVDFRFSPPVPDVTGLKDGVEVEGLFVLSGEPSIGKVSGAYYLQRLKDRVALMVHPKGGWQPNEKLFTVRLIYRLVGVFRSWPKTYQWKSTLIETALGWQESSGWTRTSR